MYMLKLKRALPVYKDPGNRLILALSAGGGSTNQASEQGEVWMTRINCIPFHSTQLLSSVPVVVLELSTVS